MLVSEHKKFSDKIVPEIFLRFLHKVGLTGNILTLLSSICTLAAFYFFWEGNVLMGGVMAGFDWIFDFLDGKVARLYNKDSKLGSLLDFFSDRLRMSWLIGLAYSSVISFQLAILVLFLEAMLHLTSYYIELKGLKHVKWLPNNVHLLTFGALLNVVVIFLYIKIVIGSFLLITQFISTIIMNMNNKDK